MTNFEESYQVVLERNVNGQIYYIHKFLPKHLRVYVHWTFLIQSDILKLPCHL